METYQQLSLAIAASDLRYIAGSNLSAGGHPRTWPFTQWGAMVAYETTKMLRETHSLQLKPNWEDTFAKSARHSGKFFDGRTKQLDQVVKNFRRLVAANHTAFYPENRPGPEYDYLRDDLSVVTDGDEVLLTNITGLFMVGIPPERGLDMDAWGPHVLTLTSGIGQVAAAIVGESVEQMHHHGNHSEEALTWSDGKIAEVLPIIFGGELETDLALALLSIHSSVQSARRWARTQCCASCEVAALKHRFVVLHQAMQSLHQLGTRLESFRPIAVSHLQPLVESPGLSAVVSRPFRRLRNGWLHLGFDDIASDLPQGATILTPISVYTQMQAPEFAELVDQGLNEIAVGLGAWLTEAGPDGSTLFNYLEPVAV